MDVIFLEEQAPTFHQRSNKPRQGVGRSVAKSSDRCGETNESSNTASIHGHTVQDIYLIQSHLSCSAGCQRGSVRRWKAWALGSRLLGDVGRDTP